MYSISSREREQRTGLGIAIGGVAIDIGKGICIGIGGRTNVLILRPERPRVHGGGDL